MSKLCKIESPISLRLMSLNFGRGRGEGKRGRVQEKSKRAERKLMLAAVFFFFLRKFTQGVRGRECDWMFELGGGHGCGCLNVDGCITSDASHPQPV